MPTLQKIRSSKIQFNIRFEWIEMNKFGTWWMLLTRAKTVCQFNWQWIDNLHYSEEKPMLMHSFYKLEDLCNEWKKERKRRIETCSNRAATEQQSISTKKVIQPHSSVQHTFSNFTISFSLFGRNTRHLLAQIFTAASISEMSRTGHKEKSF